MLTGEYINKIAWQKYHEDQPMTDAAMSKYGCRSLTEDEAKEVADALEQAVSDVRNARPKRKLWSEMTLEEKVDDLNQRLGGLELWNKPLR